MQTLENKIVVDINQNEVRSCQKKDVEGVNSALYDRGKLDKRNSLSERQTVQIYLKRVHVKREDSFKEDEDRYLQLDEHEKEEPNKYEITPQIEKAATICNANHFRTTEKNNLELKNVHVHDITEVDEVREEVIQKNKVSRGGKKKLQIFTSDNKRKRSSSLSNITTGEKNASREHIRIQYVPELKVITENHSLEPSSVHVYNIDEIKEVKEEVIQEKSVSRVRKKKLHSVFSLVNKKVAERKHSTSFRGTNNFSNEKLSKYPSLNDVSLKNKDLSFETKQEKTMQTKDIARENHERTGSITDKVRAVVSGRTKNERTENEDNVTVDLHEKKKGSKFGTLRNRIKHRRSSSSGDISTLFHLPKNDVVGSQCSNDRTSSESFARQSSHASLSSACDIQSRNSLDSVDEESVFKETAFRYTSYFVPSLMCYYSCVNYLISDGNKKVTGLFKVCMTFLLPPAIKGLKIFFLILFVNLLMHDIPKWLGAL